MTPMDTTGEPFTIDKRLVYEAYKFRTSNFLQRLARDKACLFVHWRIGMTGTFA